MKIKSVWSFRNQLFVELDEGITYMLTADETSTVKDVRDRIKTLHKEERLRRKAIEQKTIDPTLKHLKELEGKNVE